MLNIKNDHFISITKNGGLCCVALYETGKTLFLHTLERKSRTRQNFVKMYSKIVVNFI